MVNVTQSCKGISYQGKKKNRSFIVQWQASKPKIEPKRIHAMEANTVMLRAWKRPHSSYSRFMLIITLLGGFCRWKWTKYLFFSPNISQDVNGTMRDVVLTLWDVDSKKIKFSSDSLARHDLSLSNTLQAIWHMSAFSGSNLESCSKYVFGYYFQDKSVSKPF